MAFKYLNESNFLSWGICTDKFETSHVNQKQFVQPYCDIHNNIILTNMYTYHNCGLKVTANR